MLLTFGSGETPGGFVSLPLYPTSPPRARARAENGARQTFRISKADPVCLANIDQGKGLDPLHTVSPTEHSFRVGKGKE